MQRRRTLVGMVTVLVLGGLVAARAQAKSAWAKPAVDTPDAIAALQKMGAFLRSQQSFIVKSQQMTDDVLSSGQKVKYSGSVVLKVRRPDRLRMDIDSDRRQEHHYYDGKTFTVFGDRVGYWAQFQAPPTLAELKEVLEKRGIDMPLADLFYWGTDQDGTAKVRTATLIGTSNLNGVPCDHYAFRQADIDWEIWIEQGPRPLPHKIVITTVTERSQPQHVMTLDWDLTPRLGEDLFTFSPPPNSHRIDFEQVKGKGAQ
jgi:hypothetical protein